MRLALILVLLGVIAAGVVEWANAAWDASGPPASNGKETIILIAPGTRTHALAQTLQDQNVVRIGLVFEFDLRLRGLSARIKAGEYAIPTRSSMAAVAKILVDGKSIQHKLTIAEGLTSDMVWKLARADTVLTGDSGPVPEEGSLLPETYLFTRGETRAHLLDKMARAQQAYLGPLWEHRAANLPLHNLREAVILASIVEKETSLPEERRHIASVFVNRLRIGMRLQTDPTVIYGLTRGYPLGRGIRQSELDHATPYNTYVIAGLPPGPICNPGKDSLAAVLAPQQSDDLFFVASGHGGHLFASTISQQARNVAAYRAVERDAQPPQSRQVENNGRADGTTITILDPSLPGLPAATRRKKSIIEPAIELAGDSRLSRALGSPSGSSNMTFASMTGFAESAGSHDGLRWRWEAKSVNSRSLDLRLRTPPGFDGLEPPARKLAGERFLRGAFQVFTIEPRDGEKGLAVDPVALAAAVRIAREVAAETGLAPARVDGLLALKGVIVADEPAAAAADPVARGHRDAAILESLALALDKLAKERGSEGAKLAAVLGAQIDDVERLVGEAGRLAAAQPAALRARLNAQIKELMDTAPVSEERLAQEVALLALKADVREELDRLGAHVQDARALIASGKGVGRKLDFLAQEFNREANTMCSKSTDIALTRTGLALKAVIDQFREQAQNVE